MLWPGKGTGAHIRGIGLDRRFDGRAKLAVAFYELRHPRRKPEHVLEHQYLTVARDTPTDADGGNCNRGCDAPRERLGHRLDHHRKCTHLGDGASVILDGCPVRFLTPLCTE